MRLKVARRRRRGAAFVEAIITTSILLTLMLGLIDMGVAVTRMHLISEASRQGARKAVCQGSLALAALNGGPWGPAAFTGNGNSGDPKVTSVKPYLTGLDLSKVTVNVTWPDGSNAAEKRVTYQVSTTWKPMMTWIIGNPSFNLSAESTMLIAH
jgi:Flp pilus assembly protein TadG